MSAAVLFAPGESMSAPLADYVRQKLQGRVVFGAVGNCYQLAPWADFLVATDAAWWRAYPDAKNFAQKKFTAQRGAGVELLAGGRFGTNINSGTLAMCAARVVYGAGLIGLFGFDMHGSHFFGQYENGLENTPPDKRQVHQKQYALWAKQNAVVRVINCTPGSELKAFELGSLQDFCTALNALCQP